LNRYILGNLGVRFSWYRLKSGSRKSFSAHTTQILISYKSHEPVLCEVLIVHRSLLETFVEIDYMLLYVKKSCDIHTCASYAVPVIDDDESAGVLKSASNVG